MKDKASRDVKSQLKAYADEQQADSKKEEAEQEKKKNPREYILSHFFYHKPKLYYFKGKGQFIPQDKDSVKRRLQELLDVSEIPDMLLEIEEANYIPTVYQTLPATRAGLRDSKGERYIILRDYYFPIPAGQQGACDTILLVLQSFFGEVQLPYFLAWVKGARHRIKQCLKTGDYSTASQILCLVGAHDLGKSNILCKKILEPFFGGGMVEYGEMLKQGKQFNGEMLNGCFLVYDDKGKPSGTNGAKRIADTMKNIGYAVNYSIEVKGKTAMSLRIPWVQMVLANTDPEGIASIPDFSEMEDKFMALFVERRDTFPPNNTDEERAALDAAIAGELAAFAWYVDHYTPPDDIRETTSGRHTCRAYVAPEIAALLQPLTEEARLMNAIELLINDRLTNDIDTVCAESGISAVQLQAFLKRRNLWKEEAGRMMGRKLSRLCEKFPERIRWRYTHNNNKVYIISRPADTSGEEE